MDTAITFMGAFFGMQNCSKVLKGGVKNPIQAFQVVACRAGRMAAEKISGAAVFVMMAESFVPRGDYSKFFSQKGAVWMWLRGSRSKEKTMKGVTIQWMQRWKVCRITKDAKMRRECT